MLEPASDGVLTDGHGITRTVGLRGSPKDVERHSDSRVGSMRDCQIEGKGVIGEIGVGVVAGRIEGGVDAGVFRNTVRYIAAQLQGLAGAPLSGSHDGC